MDAQNNFITLFSNTLVFYNNYGAFLASYGLSSTVFTYDLFQDRLYLADNANNYITVISTYGAFSTIRSNNTNCQTTSSAITHSSTTNHSGQSSHHSNATITIATKSYLIYLPILLLFITILL